MRLRSARKGVASIVGTVVFVLVFMLALGALAYAANLQAQGARAEAQAQGVAYIRAGESVTFQVTQSGLEAFDSGPSSVALNHVVLRFPNGTVYAPAANAVIPAGGETPVLPLVPAGTCAPGTATCVSKYDSIVSGAAPGASVGLVTSLGNVFWYTGTSGGSGWSNVTFLSAGTWSVPAGVTSAYVVCVGGGGGGGGTGGATATSGLDGGSGGGGGGAGSFAEGFVDLQGTTSVAVAVGQGGSGGSAGTQFTNGGPGGNGLPSSFGGYVACGGGGGGEGSPETSNGSGGSLCEAAPTSGGAGDGVPGGRSTSSGVSNSALQETVYGGGGGGGGSSSYPPGAGSPSDSLDSGTIYTGSPGPSGACAFGGGGGSASPFAHGGSGGAGASSCASGQPGGGAQANSGAGGGGGGGSYSTGASCGYKPGATGGPGGSGVVIVYYQQGA